MAKSQGLVFTPRLRLKPSAILRGRVALKAPPERAAAATRPAPALLDRRLRSLTVAGALGGSHTELLRLAVRRSRQAILCPCGGQALRVRSTPAERARFGGESFARAFVCSACHTRYVGRAKAHAAWPL